MDCLNQNIGRNIIWMLRLSEATSPFLKGANPQTTSPFQKGANPQTLDQKG